MSLIVTFDESINYKFIKSTIKNKNVITYEKADKLMEKNSDFKSFVNILECHWGEIKDSHILIEKMMIFYNNKIAELLREKDLNFPIRIHKGINKDLFDFITCSNIFCILLILGIGEDTIST